MSVLIKGMEMPKICIHCLMFDYAWNNCKVIERHVDSAYSRPDWCPLIEVDDDD